ncbi:MULTISPECIES: hypothetical protein [unclassified Bradyrhizobium]|uniref:hypothetical protein n=1 Tax=unclassified Bradyrhizobium TaxID=2631580 RepID=UPI002478ADD3|nr:MULTISPECIES: hypothetical protein [unclassified Bradyrhizobium]WGS19165.1 hypothetical protein MTX22_32655 [Bradyrhizobium sp. ISRA463]WGS26002.1 hypothetical protein MTX19_30200 [Bradyrhizobium sp. ISRA464]
MRAPAQAMTTTGFLHQIVRDRKPESAADAVDKRREQLMVIIDLIRYAEVEVLELNLETSAVLLEAAITDLTRFLD